MQIVFGAVLVLMVAALSLTGISRTSQHNQAVAEINSGEISKDKKRRVAQMATTSFRLYEGTSSCTSQETSIIVSGGVVCVPTSAVCGPSFSSTAGAPCIVMQ